MTLETAAIATNRFGLGARPGDIKTVAADPRGWLEAQIAPERALPAPLAALPSSADDASAFRRWTASIGVGPAITPARGVGMTRLGGRPSDPQGDSGSRGAMGAARLPQGMTVEGSFGQVLGARYAHAAGARFRAAVETDKPFFERWVRFWSNHFTVSATKPSVVALPPAFERDVIRRHAAGSFTEMLVASTRHPGMLVYLDQVLSIGPDSALAHNPQVLPPYVRERMKGLNENLGREILELHTLGVRSGYTQADVRALALMLTGWSVRQQDAGGGGSGDDLFRFLAPAHEPGPQTLLGKAYPDRGEEQALAALVDVSHHPATADHLATKLVRHFIADEPPPAAVARVSAAIRESRGDLPTVARTLVRSPEAWEPRLAKFKPPEDYLISAQRALNAPAQGERAVVALLAKMGQRPSSAPGPDGWADTEAAWVGADPLWKRLEWATAVSKGLATAGVDPAVIADAALGPQLTADTLHMIRAAETPAQGLAIFLVSPEFQRR